jgi:hypothetical protein
VETSGFTNAANNGLFVVKAKAAGYIELAPSGVLVNEAAGATRNIQRLSAITNGTTFRSFVVEKEFADISGGFETGVGMAVDTLSLTIEPGSIISGSVGFVGKSVASQAATVGNGSPTAANTYDVMNAVDNVPYIAENGTVSGWTQFSIEIRNNLAARAQIGTLGAPSIRSGTCEISGTLQQIFASDAIIDRYLNFTESSLIIHLKDSGGRDYLVHLPAVKYVDAKRAGGGINQDILADLSWNAKVSATFGYMMRIARATA